MVPRENILASLDDVRAPRLRQMNWERALVNTLVTDGVQGERRGITQLAAIKKNEEGWSQQPRFSKMHFVLIHLDQASEVCLPGAPQSGDFDAYI